MSKEQDGPRLPRPARSAPPDRSTEQLLHEIQVQRAELEKQNEMLRHTQLALEESRDRYIELYDFAPVGLLTLTPEATISEINHAGAVLLGEKRKELFNRHFEQFVAPGDKGRWRNIFYNALQGGENQDCELVLARANGATLHVRLDCLLMKTIGGYSVHIALGDITKHKQAKEALRNSENKYLLLFSKASFPAALLRFPDHVFVDVNDAWAQLFGYAKEELIGKTSLELGINRDAERRANIIEEVRRCHAVRNLEQTLYSKSGNAIIVSTSISVASINGQDYAITTMQDITERKRIEFEIREYQELMRELAALIVASREAEYKHVAREVHDELGQLLTALRMEVSLLRIQFGKHSPAMMEKIKDILALADKAIQGVRDVTANLRPAALDMGIVPAIGWLCDNFSGHADTACTLRVADNPAGLDDARTVAIFRIVQESLTNVARYASANSVEIMIGRQDDDVFVEVRDNGKGFDAAALPAKKSFGLMGMRERAVAVGGKVEITSAPSKGTVVSVRIPITPGRDTS